MSGNDRTPDASANGRVLHWPGRVLAVEDLRRSLNGHRELVLSPGAVVTPLAAEQLRDGGVSVTRQKPAGRPVAGPAWGYAQDRPHPLVRSAVQSLARDGLQVRELAAGGDGLACRWARAVAECVARGECQGGVLFCADPGLVCCVANKLPGLRAVAVTTVGQAARSTLTLGANLVAVEMPGRTFFEVRQILRTLYGATLACPDGVAGTLGELDGHAHR
jgi:hypothetical protein